MCGLHDDEAVAETNLAYLLKQGVCVARSVIELHNGQSQLLVTNFSKEHQHLIRGTSIAFADEVSNVSGCFTSEVLKSADKPLGHIDINPVLSTDNQTALWKLLLELGLASQVLQKCARSPSLGTGSSRTRRHARYTSSPTALAKEHEAIWTQVQEMLDDCVIEPSNSPWSSPVVLVREERWSAPLLRRLPEA